MSCHIKPIFQVVDEVITRLCKAGTLAPSTSLILLSDILQTFPGSLLLTAAPKLVRRHEAQIMATDFDYGVKLNCGAVIIHGDGANIKKPFEDMPLVMHELSPGNLGDNKGFCSFGGQLGFIEFNTDIRLPRHVHIGPNKATHPNAEQRLLAERILVLSGFAMVELCGELYVIPPKTLVHIPPGVPHTWTACPKGVDVNAAVGIVSQKEWTSDGTFLMIYEYEDTTSFCPTKRTEILKSVEEYEQATEEELEAIMIPALSASEVHQRCWFAWNREVKRSERTRKSEDDLS